MTPEIFMDIMGTKIFLSYIDYYKPKMSTCI